MTMMNAIKFGTTTAFATLILTAGVAAPTPASAGESGDQTQAETESTQASAAVRRVTGLLRSIEGLPDREAFERAAGEPEAVLWQILDSDTDGPVRTAALDALARWWPTDRVLDRLGERIAGQSDRMNDAVVIRVEAISILGRSGFGASARRLLADVLSPDRHVQVRLAAVSALGQRETEAADAILRSHARSEHVDELVFERIAEYLKD